MKLVLDNDLTTLQDATDLEHRETAFTMFYDEDGVNLTIAVNNKFEAGCNDFHVYITGSDKIRMLIAFMEIRLKEVIDEERRELNETNIR